MRAILHQSLFDKTGISHADLISLIRCCARNDYHILLTVPAFNATHAEQPLNRWLARQSFELRAEITKTLEDGQRLNASSFRNSLSVQVSAAEESDWENLALCLEDALAMLQAPLSLVLENGFNDWAFLRCLAPSVYRSALDEARKKNWLTIINGGGIGDLKKQIEALLQPITSIDRIRRLRCSVLCDRDADESDRTKPSKTSNTVVETCASARPAIPCVQLQRRTIENFLPVQALPSSPERTAFEAAVRRFKPIHWYFSMREGLLKDIERGSKKRRARFRDENEQVRKEELDPIFHSLTEDEMQTLALGFGDRLAESFDEKKKRFSEQQFQMEYDDGPEGQPTRESILQHLLSRI